ncbi:MAG: hypothetical protein GF398_02275 [Chitinivibrionales bacterium]|nr:hypothetical protein [Chitinivibrionales bacterium]
MANDEVGCMPMDYLSRRRIAVPKHISIMAFDNGLESLRRGMSTYSFNNHALARSRLLRFLPIGILSSTVWQKHS